MYFTAKFNNETIFGKFTSISSQNLSPLIKFFKEGGTLDDEVMTDIVAVLPRNVKGKKLMIVNDGFDLTFRY